MSLLLLAALVGVGLTFVNEVIKQNHLKKWQNTVIADVVQIVGAAIVAIQATGTSRVTWGDFGKALFAAGSAWVITYSGVLKPIVGNRLQDATSIKQPPVA